MADRNPLLVSGERKAWFKRVLSHGSGDRLDPAEIQRMEAELVKQARMGEFRRKTPSRGGRTNLEAFQTIKEGEPGSNRIRASKARTRALKRSQRHQPKHGRQHVTR